ncbi:hypothetical protein HHE03_06130 [Helicobacter heilmannii]|nr:hypothetical protein HHE03_06130 [Helicobacter heilmannii]
MLNVFFKLFCLMSRQVCYVVSMLEPFSGMGRRVFCMIHTFDA